VPFTNLSEVHSFKKKAQLKDIDFDFDESIFTNFNAPKKLKAKVEAKCTNGHVLTLSAQRPRRCGWSCDWCRASHSADPGFAFYCCAQCDQDTCPNCFHNVETVIEKAKDGEDPNIIKEKQILFSKKHNCYV
tara:strand:- start:772 stop:1167 length:396 start_codon:yes stop_codon:yes gene_type:complete